MIIVVALLRQSFLKGLGSVIDEALHRGHDVVILRDPEVASKAGEEISPEQISGIWPGIRVQDVDLRNKRTRRRQVVGCSDRLDMMDSNHLSDIVEAAITHGVAVYSVSDLYETALCEPAFMEHLTCTFYVSRHQHDLHRSFRSRAFTRLDSAGVRPPIEFVGCTYNDQRRVVRKEDVRRRFGISAGVPVVLFMTLKMGVPEPFRRFVWGEGSRLQRSFQALARAELRVAGNVWRGPHYRDIVIAVRQFRDREGAFLIGKSRLKNSDPEWMRSYFDLYLDRDQVEYPYTAMQKWRHAAVLPGSCDVGYYCSLLRRRNMHT